MLTAYLLYDNFTGLDVTGPHDVLSSVPGAESVFVARRPGPIRSDRGALTMVAEYSFADALEPDVVIVPGGTAPDRCSKTSRFWPGCASSLRG